MRHHALALLLSLSCVNALAQPYPSRPIRFIVPTAPGGGIDVMARLVGPPMAEALGQPVVVENRGGLGGQLGTDAVVKSAADGHTLLVSTDAVVSQMPVMKLPYDPIRDLEPLAILSTLPYALAVNPGVAKDMDEFAKLARSKPNAATYGTPGVGSPQHLIALMFSSLAGATLLHVPYKGAGEIVPAVISGQVHALFQPISGMVPNIKAGKLRAFAVSAPERSFALPDVPTLAELGYKEMTKTAWLGLWIHPDAPAAAQQRIRDETLKALAVPAVRDKLMGIGLNVNTAKPPTPEEMWHSLDADFRSIGETLRSVNYKPE